MNFSTYTVYNNSINIYQNLDQEMDQQILLNQFFENLEYNDKYLQLLRSQPICSRFKLKQLGKISPKNVWKFVNQLKDKSPNSDSIRVQQLQIPKQIHWGINQFKYFFWIIVCYSKFFNKPLSKFKEEDYNFFQYALPNKQRRFLEYHCITLSRQKNYQKPKKWKQEQKKMLQQVLEQQSLIGKWNQVSLHLYILSDRRIYRCPQNCRQQWHNHLNPDVKRQKWELQEELQLFQLILQRGYRWATISKIMKNLRTQHMVKNHYKSTLKRYQKMHPSLSQSKIDSIILQDLKKQLNIKETSEKDNINYSTEIPLSLPKNIEEHNLQAAEKEFFSSEIQQQGDYCDISKTQKLKFNESIFDQDIHCNNNSFFKNDQIQFIRNQSSENFIDSLLI